VPGIRIRHVRIHSEVVEEYYSIPYETVIQPSDAIQKGELILKTKGVNGIRTRQILVRYENGVEVSREQISEVITRQPVNKVVLEGTYVAPTATARPTQSQPAGPQPTPTRHPVYGNIDPADLVVPEKPVTFAQTMTVEITAYTHTGNRCATGVWPRYTRSLRNPGTVSIDPSVLGYGWLVYIPGYGYAVTEDCGVIGMRMDVFMNTEAECVRWGRRRNVEVYIIGPYEGPDRK